MTTFNFLDVAPALIAMLFAVGVAFLLGTWVEGVKILGTEIPTIRHLTNKGKNILRVFGILCLLTVVLGYVPFWTPARLIDIEMRSAESLEEQSEGLAVYAPRCRIWVESYFNGTYRVTWSVRSNQQLPLKAWINGHEVVPEDSADYVFEKDRFEYQRHTLYASNAVGDCGDEAVVFLNQDAEMKYYETLNSNT